MQRKMLANSTVIGGKGNVFSRAVRMQFSVPVETAFDEARAIIWFELACAATR